MRSTQCLCCELKQRETESGLCRRCGAPLSPGVYPQKRLDWHVLEWEIGHAISTYRRARGMEQEDLAATGVATRGTLSRLETHTLNASIGKIERLAEALHVPFVWLISEVTEDRVSEVFATEVLQAVRSTQLKLEDVLRLVCHMSKGEEYDKIVGTGHGRGVGPAVDLAVKN
jgi:transcriptional regulator with XRE-family HTH domain